MKTLPLVTMADPEILLPTLIDNLTAEEPDRLFCAYAESAAEADVLHQVMYKAFANAVNACAWWLQSTLGEGLNFGTVAYLGPSDVQPAIIAMAAAKVNRKARYPLSGPYPSHDPCSHTIGLSCLPSQLHCGTTKTV
jgi:hypothetical protein